MEKILIIIAYFTRLFHPRGTQRFLRIIYNPETVQKAIHTVFTYDNNIKIQIDTSSEIEWNLWFLGEYESSIRNVIKKHFKNGGVFVDVGANVGIHTLVAAKVAKEVIAFEPVPETMARLRENCKLNNFNNVEILPYVVSDIETERILYRGVPSQPGASSLYNDSNTTSGMKCRSVSLDSMFRNKKVDFIKIDVEGEDGRVLLGAREIIKRDRPVIVFEHSVKWNDSGVSLDDVMPILNEYNVSVLNGEEMLCIPK